MDVIVDLASGERASRLRSGRTHSVEATPDALSSDVHTLQADLHRAVRGEQIRDVVPHLPIDVVAVCVLKIRDVDLVAQTLRTGGEIGQAGRQRLDSGLGTRGSGLENRSSDLRRIEMKWSRIARRGPAGILIAARVLRKVADVFEFPDAVLADILVLVNAACPG